MNADMVAEEGQHDGAYLHADAIAVKATHDVKSTFAPE